MARRKQGRGRPRPDAAPVDAVRTGARQWLIAAALMLATLAIYAPVRQFDFVTYDDLEFVAENPFIASGLTWQNVRWSLANAYDATGGPLTWLSHMIDVELFGLDAGGHHLTSLLLHVANTLLLFGVLTRMTGRVAASAGVAALFAVHPLHVESVAWVAQRKDVLSTLFWLLAMWAYAGYARRPRHGAYLAVTLLIALGLLSKPMVATLPFVLLLLDVWPLQRPAPIRALVVEKLPWIGMAVLSLLFTVLSQQRGGSLPGLEQVSLPTRLGNALISYVTYLVKFVWPASLTPHYPYDVTLSAGLVIGCAVLLVLITVIAWRHRYTMPSFGVGWAWYLVTLVPVIGLVQVGTHAMADRFTYVPSIGVFILIVWLLTELARRWRLPPSVLGVASGVVLLALAIAARGQVGIWRDGLTLWEHAVRVSPQDARPHLNLGVTLSRQRRFPEAIDAYRNAIRLSPSLPHAHSNLALALKETGQITAAMSELEEAVRLDPEYAAAHANLADLLAAHGDVPSASAHYEQAIRLDPRAGLPRINYSITLAQAGRVGEALPQAIAALERDPSRTDWRFVAAMLLKELGRRDEAIREMKNVLAQEPNHPHARRELTNLCGGPC